MTTLKHSQRTLFENDADESTLLPPEFPVSPQVSPAKDLVLTIRDGYGLIFCELCGTADHDMCWRKILLASLVRSLSELNGSSVSWLQRDMNSCRSYWALTMSALLIDENECLYSEDWPTPTATETATNMPNGKRGESLYQKANGALWQSAKATDEKDPRRGNDLRHGRQLAEEAREWPTPAETQAKQGMNEPDGKRGQTLVGAARAQEWPTPKTQNMSGTAVNRPPNRQGGMDLQTAVHRLWMTPKAAQAGMTAKTKNRKIEKSTHLQTQALLEDGRHDPESSNENGNTQGSLKEWPTATAGRGMGSGTNGTIAINAAMGTPGQKKNYHGLLNPAWVAQLMGFPDGWLDCLELDEIDSKRSEIQLSRNSSKKSVKR